MILPWWAWCPGLVLAAVAVRVAWETAAHARRMAGNEAQEWVILWRTSFEPPQDERERKRV